MTLPNNVGREDIEANVKNFIEEYDALCKKYGLKFEPQPILIPTNHGTCEIGAQIAVIKTQ